MSRILLAAGCAGAAMALAITPAFGADRGCSRSMLQAAVDSYVAAQTAGDVSRMRLADDLVYKEDRGEKDIAQGVLTRPLAIDHVLTLLDSYQCETFSEVIAANQPDPHVLGVHLKLNDNGDITYIDTLVTDSDDWLFNAKNTLHWHQQEDWSEVPAPNREQRQTLRNAANAYLDLFNDKTVLVPFGVPCRRLEGGAYTGGPVWTEDDSCAVGVPDGVAFPVREYVIDTHKNAIVALVPFGGPEGLPDSHMFRTMNGLLTNVHTITVCNREGQVCPQVKDWDAPDSNAAPPQ